MTLTAELKQAFSSCVFASYNKITSVREEELMIDLGIVNIVPSNAELMIDLGTVNIVHRDAELMVDLGIHRNRMNP